MVDLRIKSDLLIEQPLGLSDIPITGGTDTALRADLNALAGVTASVQNYGVMPGSTLTDNQSGKELFDEIDAALDDRPLSTNFVDPSTPIPIAAATAMAASDINGFVVCSGTVADYTVMLPPVTALNIGDAVHINIDRNCTQLITVSAAAASGLNVDGVNSRTMWAGEDAYLVYDGTQWTKIQGHSIPFVIKLNCAASFALASTFNYIPLVQGEQINDNAAAFCFNVDHFVAPRDMSVRIDIPLWASNFAGGGTQMDLGNITAGGSPGTAAPDTTNFDRVSIVEADTFRTVKAGFSRRLAKGNHLSPSARFLAPTTAANVGTLVSSVVITEIDLW